MAKEFELIVCEGIDAIIACSNCLAIKENNGSGVKPSEKKWFYIEDDPIAWHKIFSHYHNVHGKRGISHGLCYPCSKEIYPSFDIDY